MKKTSKRKRPAPDDVRAEYRFDYSKAKPNRFAASMSGSTVAVAIDPDVASILKTSEAVNSLLRSVIAALPDNIGRPSKSV
jgi:hypothetical protein